MLSFIKNIYLKIFLKGFFIGVLVFCCIFTYHYLSILKKRSEINEENVKIINNIDSKKFYSVVNNELLKFHKDTIYLIYYPPLNYEEFQEQEMNNFNIIVSKNAKKIKFIIAYSTEQEKYFKEWSVKMKSPKKYHYKSNDLNIENLKLIVYRNKIQYHTTKITKWDIEKTNTFFTNLQNK